MTITEFLTARLDEDEAVARAARHEPGKEWSWASVDYNSAAAEAHGMRWSPVRVLAEVEAKRTIVEEFVREDAANFGDQFLDGLCTGLERAVRLLAQTYADHPDYREEWRP